MNNAVHSEDRGARHELRRDELLAAAADYVLAHGLAGLSIRPLAAALGLSHRTLLYYFESKDKIVLAVLELIRERDRQRIVEHLGGLQSASWHQLFRAAWADFCAPERLPYLRFFHEALVLATDDPTFRQWLRTTIESRTRMIAAALVRVGLPEARARRASVLLLAAVRGLQLHLLATGDRFEVDAAFEELLSTVDGQLPS